jgi:hypothetical protein
MAIIEFVMERPVNGQAAETGRGTKLLNSGEFPSLNAVMGWLPGNRRTGGCPSKVMVFRTESEWLGPTPH